MHLNKASTAIIILCFTVITLGKAQSIDYRIDPRHSVVGFTIKIAGGLSEVDGMFNDFQGSIQLDAKSFTVEKINATINVSSIYTGVKGRDEHLREEDFFFVEKYPTIEFSSSDIKQTGNQEFIASGDLFMHGVTKTIGIPFKKTHREKYVWVFGNPTVVFEGGLKVNRKDYNIQANARWNNIVEATGDIAMSDEVTIKLKIIAEGESPRLALLEGAIKDGAIGYQLVSKKLLEKYPDLEIKNEQFYNFVGYRLIRGGHHQKAIEIFTLWVENFPDSFNAHDSLGEGYLLAGNHKKAALHYRKSLKLNPENENARNKLKEIETN